MLSLSTPSVSWTWRRRSVTASLSEIQTPNWYAPLTSMSSITKPFDWRMVIATAFALGAITESDPDTP